jgi:hypothetical protein
LQGQSHVSRLICSCFWCLQMWDWRRTYKINSNSDWWSWFSERHHQVVHCHSGIWWWN